jgi:hypothetical protein
MEDGNDKLYEDITSQFPVLNAHTQLSFRFQLLANTSRGASHLHPPNQPRPVEELDPLVDVVGRLRVGNHKVHAIGKGSRGRQGLQRYISHDATASFGRRACWHAGPERKMLLLRNISRYRGS